MQTTLKSDVFVRRDVTFPSGDARCAAWLYEPHASRPYPVVIMAPGLGGVREAGLPAYAERFCEAGYACLVFDYRHFGASEGEPRQLLDIRRQLVDWKSAIAFVRNQPELDASRVFLWGTSFAGGHVLATAAEDPAIACAIVQAPFTDGLASARSLDVWSALKVLPFALADIFAGWLDRRPITVPLWGAPRTAALMTAPDALPALELLTAGCATSRNQVAARIALSVLFYRPGRRAKEIECPVLFSVAESDTVAPAATAYRYAAKVPRGEVIAYPYGHFDIYLGEPFERVMTDQLAFLARMARPA